ncbi:hypothetical protein Acr_16g0000410 [Actinidia rufa]|uniref:Reverse transcriptase Ty1/copia-type domain-containing protein n=1 Tax=Actinidia rufa TaxID=165716 RepID=A0A7J0FY69_9ERIC|nr:hypothetical protein Acr_16g0000410 [Actinidia rufa]
MCTRAKSGLVKPKLFQDFVTFHTKLPTEPKNFKHALEHPQWKQAMTEEFSALQKNKTWSLVPFDKSMNLLGCKWVFKLKQKADDSVERYKARLVAKGFLQQDGEDFNETFSPVVKIATVRTILTIAITNKWPIKQLDVSNAFLHGDLKEKVYMAQPPGFIDNTKPGHVCLLHKSLYGLKQAPRAWFDKFDNFLLLCGFKRSIADNSMFVCHTNKGMLVLLLYVDDIILTGTSEDLIHQLISKLKTQFAMKDLGSLHYFLGIEAKPDSSNTSLLLTQSKYTIDLLKRTNMLQCKPIDTPVKLGPRLSISDGDPIENSMQYRSTVGALQYLTITRPDITFAVNYVCQFMHSPRSVHWQAVKRILRYLRGSLGFGIEIKPSNPCYLSSLSGYYDADWAGCPDSRRSTTGYCIFLGSNLISWNSRKQPTVSRSTAEAEYRAMASTTAELLWLSYLLRELGLPSEKFKLFTDNMSAKCLAYNPVFHSRSKHIDIDYHFIRELVSRGKLDISFVSSQHQLADVMTKSLGFPSFLTLRSQIYGAKMLISLRREILADVI